MVITTYKVHTIADNDFWYLTECLAFGEKKVVIHHMTPEMLKEQSAFSDVDQAKRFWNCLDANDWQWDEAATAFRREYLD